jgi:hypothetical protein
MSFTGDLEHLPIVDVIQLLHSTRKSGVLRVLGRKGESQLVFKDGYIVSANHLNNSIRIGQILVEQKVITDEVLSRVLEEQQGAGQERKPLIISLVEKGLVKEQDAYKGLEYLIELTIVEILTWKRGTFILDMHEESAVSDEYRYYPQKMGREINVDTQSVLMDALRIFDEKVRDGELQEEELTDEESAPEGGGDDLILTADDLGLTELDQMERSVPDVFTTLEDLDPIAIHRQNFEDLAVGLNAGERKDLFGFLVRFVADSGAGRGTSHGTAGAQNIILFSHDGLLSYAVATVCEREGFLVQVSRHVQEMERFIDQSLVKLKRPLLVLDAPNGLSSDHGAQDSIREARQLLGDKYPYLSVIQLVSPLAYGFALESLRDGALSVFPRPVREERQASFVSDFIDFLESLRAYVRRKMAEPCSSPVTMLHRCAVSLRDRREPPDVALALLTLVAESCTRSLTLVVGQGELIAEKGIGVKAELGREVSPPLGFRMPLAASLLLQRVIAEGQPFYGNCHDVGVEEHLFAAIGAPSHATILLLPMRARGKTISLTYGDFGGNVPVEVSIELLEILSFLAELVLDNAIFRKRLEKVG